MDFAACVNEYFYGEMEASSDINSCEDPLYKGYKAVLDSKSTVETLVSNLSLLLLNFKTSYHIV